MPNRVVPPPPATLGSGRRRPLHLTAAALVAAAGFLLAGQGILIHAKAALAQVLLERAFSRSLAEGAPVKPWSWADTWPIARLSVPRLGESAIVLASGSGQALAFGPGHLAGTPEPGDAGTSVIAAHRDTHFDFLGRVEIGDEIIVDRADGETRRFRVSGSRVVRYDAFGIDPGAGVHRLALTTCWPLGAVTSGPLRFVVEAELVTD
ncbi:MAG: class GN sortase [Hyphomicrobiaceae bacterium]